MKKASVIDKIKNAFFKPNNKQNAEIDELYYYLINNCVGYEKRTKSTELMNKFDIRDNKTFRRRIENIRNGNYEKIICSESGLNGGYWIAQNQDEVYETLNHLYKRAMQMLKTYSTIKKQARLDNQYRLKLKKDEKEIVESIMR